MTNQSKSRQIIIFKSNKKVNYEFIFRFPGHVVRIVLLLYQVK
jgi:hypothetical protein